MQIECEYCGAPLNTPRKFRNNRRAPLRSPKMYKIIVCLACGKKNLIKI